MRRHHHLLELEQRRGARRLLGERVERRAGDVPLDDRPMQRRLVEQAAARAVDDPHARPGLGERRGGQEVAGALVQGRVQR